MQKKVAGGNLSNEIINQSKPELHSLIQQYERVEKSVEEAIRRQEQIIRDSYRIFTHEDIELSKSNGLKKCLVSHGTGATTKNERFKDFRYLVQQAQSIVPSGLPNTRRRFLTNASAHKFDDLETVDAEVKLLKYEMGILEQKIFDYTPCSTLEAAGKLRFIANILVEGGSVEVDYFAYLVDECAEVVEIDTK